MTDADAAKAAQNWRSLCYSLGLDKDTTTFDDVWQQWLALERRVLEAEERVNDLGMSIEVANEHNAD